MIRPLISVTGGMPIFIEGIYGRVFARFCILAATSCLLILSPLSAAQEEAPTVEEEDSIIEGQRCLSSRPIRKTEVLDDQNILFYIRGAAIYLNHLPKPCKNLAREGRFLYRTTVARICRSDIINILTDSGGGLGLGRACKLGTFYAITREDVEKLKTPRAVEPKTIPPAEPEEPGTGASGETERSEGSEKTDKSDEITAEQEQS